MQSCGYRIGYERIQVLKPESSHLEQERKTENRERTTENDLKAFHINGNELTLDAVREVAVNRRPVLLDPDAREAVDRARAVVDNVVAKNQVSYAITTGVGKLSDVRIAGDQIRELQVFARSQRWIRLPRISGLLRFDRQH